MSKRLLAVLGGVVVIVAVIGVGGFVLLDDGGAEAFPEAETALVSDDDVTVEMEPWITLRPDAPASTGLVLYPGFRVEPTAYAPSARAIAERGYLTVIVPMPFGIAAMGADKAAEVMNANPEIDRWVIGGHSIGGAMAAQFTDDNVDRVDGLAMWGAYLSEDDDISGEDILAVSVYASEDGLSSVEEIEETMQYLPPDTEYVLIEGGNHTNFGLYETQDGDGEATITPEEQQTRTVEATVALLERVEAAAGL